MREDQACVDVLLSSFVRDVPVPQKHILPQESSCMDSTDGKELTAVELHRHLNI
jgi:hypothetical protein